MRFSAWHSAFLSRYALESIGKNDEPPICISLSATHLITSLDTCLAMPLTLALDERG